MSETKKSNKTITCMVYGCEKDNQLAIKDSNEQPTEIPGIPMEINVDTHNCQIAPNGEIIRRDVKTGQVMPGKVTNKKVIEALKGKEEER